jgi:hypothetical protein
MKWLVPMEKNVLLLNMCRAQFLVTRSPQKNLVGLVFALVVAGVAPDQLVAGQESFVTIEAPNPP